VPTLRYMRPISSIIIEHHPPDANAAVCWLMNRQPERWRDKREVEHTGSIEHRVRLMSPEERWARIIELQAKAQEGIDGEREAGE
jgi:hypothetical protein